MVEPRLVTRILILDKTRRRLLFFLIRNKVNGWHFVENEVRERRLMLIVGGAHLNPKANPFVVLLRKIKDELHVIRQFEPARSRLYLPPSRTYVKLLPQGKSNQVFDGLGNVVRFNFLYSTVSRDVSDQSLAIVGHDFFRRRRSHHHVIRWDKGLGYVLRKRPLIEPVDDRRARTKVVFVPIMGRNEPVSVAGSQFGNHC